MRHTAAFAARPASTDRSPLSGPTNQRPSISAATASRAPPTPGSTTASVTLAAGICAASAASKCALARTLNAGAACNRSMTPMPGASRASTALTWPTYTSAAPKSVNRKMLMPTAGAALRRRCAGGRRHVRDIRAVNVRQALEHLVLAQYFAVAHRHRDEFGCQQGQRDGGNGRIAQVPGLRLHAAPVLRVRPVETEACDIGVEPPVECMKHAARRILFRYELVAKAVRHRGAVDHVDVGAPMMAAGTRQRAPAQNALDQFGGIETRVIAADSRRVV